MTEEQRALFDQLERSEQAVIMQIMLSAGTKTNGAETDRLVSSFSVGGRRLLARLMIDGLNHSEIQEKKNELIRAIWQLNWFNKFTITSSHANIQRK